MGMPVITVAAGGLPVVDVSALAPTRGTPVTEATNGRGTAVTKVVGGPGMPVVYETIGVVAGDQFFSNVKLLLGFNGANLSTGAPGMTDESPSARGNATIIGGAQISTSQFKFGASSFSPNSGGITFPDSPDWILSSANSDKYTVEAWFRFNSLAVNKIFLAQYTVDGTVGWSFQIPGGNANEFEFLSATAGTFASMVGPVSSGAALTTNTWCHLAADKDATGKIRLYKDGVMVGSSTPANSAIYDSPVALGIGITPQSAGTLDGFIDELRITKGVARYASDAGFSVPTAAFPRS